MDHRDPVAVPPEEDPHGLRRQGDLRHEHDRAAPVCEHPVDRGEDNVGLARSRHPVEQRRRGLSAREQFFDLPVRARLFVGQNGLRRLFDRPGLREEGLDGEGIAVIGLLRRDEQPLFREGLRRVVAGSLRESRRFVQRTLFPAAPFFCRMAERVEQFPLVPSGDPGECGVPGVAIGKGG